MKFIIMKKYEKPEEYIRRLEESNEDLRKQLNYKKYCEWVNYELEEENSRMKDIIMDNIKENEQLEEENKKLKRRIWTMQDFIDYWEDIVKEVIDLLNCEEYDKALNKLEFGYVVWDDKQYELMEKAEEDEKKKLVSPLNEMIDKRVLEEIKKLRKALYMLTEKYWIRKVFKWNTLLYERKDSDCNLLDDEML